MTIALPTEKSKKQEDLKRLCILLYGAPKIGKSTWASNAEGAVFLATEAGQNSLEVFKIPEDVGCMATWQEMLDAQQLLLTQKHAFKTVVIDTIDQAYHLCSKHMLEKFGKIHESDLGFGKGFTIVTNELYRYIGNFIANRFGVIMISHATEKTIELPSGQEIQRMVPTLMANARRAVMGMVDAILYAEVNVSRKEDGTPLYTRVLRTKATTNYEAGDRMQPPLPPTIPLDYGKFVEAWKNRAVASAPKATMPPPKEEKPKPAAVTSPAPITQPAATIVPPPVAAPTAAPVLPPPAAKAIPKGDAPKINTPITPPAQQAQQPVAAVPPPQARPQASVAADLQKDVENMFNKDKK